jgi:hypothetical protein
MDLKELAQNFQVEKLEDRTEFWKAKIDIEIES